MSPMTKLRPLANHYGHDVGASIPPKETDVFEQFPLLARLWEKAKTYLSVRSNDAHTLYSLSLAQSLLKHHPQADPLVVLPAILLHDIGWSQVDPQLVLSAIAPGAGNKELVLQHEKSGAELAAELLHDEGFDAERSERIVFIIDGHDSRKESTSLEDSLVKDADKLWRLTPHGVDTVMDWFGLTRSEAFQLVESRVSDHLFTDAARFMASAFAAVESANLFEQRLALSD